ncbi:MAG: hypothetical protein KF773_16465 [Deltaproteobacteria bacterium]|nr:hypothetical protein [Deltaproteobacteria bacterium]
MSKKRNKDAANAPAKKTDDGGAAAGEAPDDGGDGDGGAAEAPKLPKPPGLMDAVGKKRLIWILVIVAAIWAFTISTGSMILTIVVGTLTAIAAGLFLWALRQLRKQQKIGTMLHGAVTSPEARRDALAKLSEGKDANEPVQLFARAQLLSQDDPKAGLALIEKVDLKVFPAAMQDDVSLLKAQLFLGFGRTQDARKCADVMNLDNPSRKEVRAYAASVVGEAWARTGKSKEALALLDTIELPKDNREQIAIQIKVARIFARFAGGNRNAARTELVALADENVDLLSRFLAPQFRVHPELQKIARRVLESHPQARKMAKIQAKQQMR